MKIDILTLFPEMFQGVMNSSMLKIALEKKSVSLNLINFRDFSTNKHKTVDDYPYGGGSGMLLKPEPIFSAVESISGYKDARIVLLTPQGRPYTQKVAEELKDDKHLIFICGHYEGFDERIREYLATDEISLGDFVLTGGELASMVIVDSVIRLLPGVLGNNESASYDSFSCGLLEYPQYTRPEIFREWKVPNVLISGHHKNIEIWRKQESLRRTFERREELINYDNLSVDDKLFLKSLENKEEI